MATAVWPPPPTQFSCPPQPFFCPPPCPAPPCPQFLPLTTGRVGISQGTGIIEFSGYNTRGTGIQDFRGYCTQWKPPCLPVLGGWGTGGGGGCDSFSNALAAVLTGKCTAPPA